LLKRYNKDHSQTDISNITENYKPDIVLSGVEFGFDYEFDIQGRKSNLPNEDRFYSDMVSIDISPNIKPITINNVLIEERFINGQTTFDISFVYDIIDDTSYTYIDISLLDGFTTKYSERIERTGFTETNNILYKQIELSENEFGKQFELQYAAYYVNDPYKNVQRQTETISKKEPLELTNFDASMNIQGENLLFNIDAIGVRPFIDGDTLELSITYETIVDEKIVDETYTFPFPFPKYYTINELKSKFYGKALVARLTWIPLYYPSSFGNDTKSHTFQTEDYKIPDLVLSGDIIVNENEQKLEYTPIITFKGLPSLQHITNVDTFSYPQLKSDIITDDYRITYDICGNGEFIERNVFDGSGNLVKDGDVYKGTPIDMPLDENGKKFDIHVKYELKNTDLFSTDSFTIPAANRPSNPENLLLKQNYSFSPPDLSYVFSFQHTGIEFSDGLDHFYLRIFNRTKQLFIIDLSTNSTENSFANLTRKKDDIYTYKFPVQSDPSYYNDILDISCGVEHYTLKSDFTTKSIQNTLETPYVLNANAILNTNANPVVGYEISNITFLHDGRGVPPFASVSYELFHLEDNTYITNGTVLYDDLIKSGTEKVLYRFPNPIGIDATIYYLDKMRLSVQLIYENLQSKSISYDEFPSSPIPAKPDIKAAKYNPANPKRIHITFEHSEPKPEDVIWHFSNVVLYSITETDRTEFYNQNYRLFDYDSPFTNKLITFDPTIRDNRLYNLDVLFSDITDVTVKNAIDTGSIGDEYSIKAIDVCLNVIGDLFGKTETISLKASLYDVLTDDLKFEVGFKNLVVVDTSLQYHDFKITYEVEPPEEQQFISEYQLWSYNSSNSTPPLNTSYSFLKTIVYNEYEGVDEYLIGTEQKLVKNRYYWFKIRAKLGNLISTLADSERVNFIAPENVLDLSFATFDFGHEIRKNILDIDVSFTLDITPVRENMNIILDISGFNNQDRPTNIYENGVLVPFVFPLELPNLSPKIYIYNDWKQSISVSAKYKNVILKTLNYIEETPITLEDITATAFRNGLYKTTYVIQWKKINITAQIEIYSYIVENVFLSYEDAKLIPIEEYSILGVVSSFNSSFSFNQPRMREIPSQTQVIRFRATYNPESELSEPIVLYQTNCGYPNIQTEKKQIVSKGGFTKKELYAKGFRGRLF
jgi:hypothetical protein